MKETPLLGKKRTFKPKKAILALCTAAHPPIAWTAVGFIIKVML